jgi:hypothetical protein
MLHLREDAVGFFTSLGLPTIWRERRFFFDNFNHKILFGFFAELILTQKAESWNIDHKQENKKIVQGERSFEKMFQEKIL